MIIYNVTTKVDHVIRESWLTWLRNEHIPEIIATGCLSKAVILHLLEADDEDGITYAVQYHSENKELFNDYINKHAPELRSKAVSLWGNKIISYRTIMETVN